MSDLRESLTQSGTLYGFINTIVYAHDYSDLSNKPQINGVTLQGNKTASELGLVTPATEAVQSVNGETGAVVLDGNDIAYDSSNTINQQIDAVAASIPVMAVTSVNGETGDVVLDGSDIRYDADYTVSAKIAAVEGEIPVVPVQSVNGETGNVVLDGDDIAYNSSLSVNQKIDAVEAAIPVVSYPVTSVNSKTGAVVLDDTDIEHSSGVSVNSLINTIMNYTPVYGNTANGSIATFETSLALPLQDCTIAINAVQESGTPTPSSPKAISGFTGANIKVVGANLWDEVYRNGYYNNSGAFVSQGSTVCNTNPIFVDGGMQLYIHSGTYHISIFFYDVNGNYLSNLYHKENTVITVPASAKTMNWTADYGEGSTYNNDISINYPATDTAYHAYNANSTTTAITWQSEAGTVYGGSYRSSDKKLINNRLRQDLKDLGWLLQSEDTNVAVFVNGYIATQMLDTNLISNCLSQSIPSGTAGRMVVGGNNFFVALPKSELGSLDEAGAKQWFEDNNCYIVYYTKTPIEYTITDAPPTPYAIVGTNNVFTDTNGNTSVVYACSLKDYIDSH